MLRDFGSRISYALCVLQ